MALEQIRASNYPAKPSRLEACFVCLDLEAQEFYVRAMSLKGGASLHPVLYEVEKVDPNAAEHRSDFNVVEPLPRLAKTMEEIAHLYWNAGLWITIADAPWIRCEEMVTNSPLRIVRALGEQS